MVMQYDQATKHNTQLHKQTCVSYEIPAVSPEMHVTLSEFSVIFIVWLMRNSHCGKALLLVLWQPDSGTASEA
jgi:hypothetical protein